MSFSNNNKREIIFHIYRSLNDKGVWCPAVEDVEKHEITPLWIAGVIYAIFSRYIDSVEESKQTEFQEMALHFFKYLIENGENYIERIPKDDYQKYVVIIAAPSPPLPPAPLFPVPS